MPVILSILTPTLSERANAFERLRRKIAAQIADSGYDAQVEHLWFCDNREHSIGHKRNVLLAQARGEFSVFLDDDDGISDDYVALICQAIRENPGIDCVGIKGVIYFSGQRPHTFVHSLHYPRYFKQDDIYYRPPLHINPIRREIALRYPFEHISYSEDMDWAMRIGRDQVLKREYLIDKPIYFYYSRRRWRYQLFIDRTERVRQALGLQLANRVRFRRWLRGATSP